MHALLVPLFLASALASAAEINDARARRESPSASSTRPIIGAGIVTADVPMDLSTGRPRIAGSINSGPSEAIEFDTGSDGPALIQRTHAERLKLRVVGEQSLASPYANAAPVKAQLVQLDSVTIGGVTASNVRAIVMDDASFLGADAPLIIGPHQFPGHVVTLDYPKGEFQLSTGTPPGAKGWQQRGSKSYLEAVLVVAGQRIPLHIDSGNPGALMLPKRFSERLTGNKTLLQPIGAMRTVDREIPMFLGDVGRDAVVAGVPVNLGKTIFAEIPYANLGSQGLGNFRIVIDNPRKRWRLEASGTDKPLLETRPMRRPAA